MNADGMRNGEDGVALVANDVVVMVVFLACVCGRCGCSKLESPFTVMPDVNL